MSENKNMRELSMDEMDKVSGGSFSINPDGTCNVNGATMTKADFEYMIFSMAKNISTDAAIDWLRINTGYYCSEIRSGGTKGDSEGMDNIGVIMNHFWAYWEGKSHW